MISTAALTRRRATAVRRFTDARLLVGLGSLFAVSAVTESVLTRWHTSPRFFPDEYIYSAISHSIGHGHLLIRGQPANFPAILQPLLAAPAWHFLPAREAYHVIQTGNAVLASLVIVPLWLLGRRLELPRLVIWLACLLAVVVPSMALIAATIADFVAYPLAVGAVAAAVASLSEPTKKRQVLFLGLALLATLGKVQYFVLVPAYLVGAVVLDRRQALRRHPVAFLGIAPAAVGAALAAFGYYTVTGDSFNGATAKWVAIQAFMVAAPIAAALVPGALVAWLRPANRVQAAFGSFMLVFAFLLLIETSVPAGQEGRYKERYLFALVPLLALGFGVYLKNGRPHARLVASIVAVLFLATPALPFASYARSAYAFDSMTLDTVSLLQRHTSDGAASTLVLLVILAGGAVALLVARFDRLSLLGLLVPCAISIACLAAAVHVDYFLNYQSPNPRWVDEATHGSPVTAVGTPSSGKLQLLEQMYWNTSIDDEIVFPFGGIATDVYAKKAAVISTTGELNAQPYFLYDRTGSQATFWNAAMLGARGWLRLYHATGNPRLRMFVENQLNTGWLSPIVRLRAWPRDAASKNLRVGFTLSLPATMHGVAHVLVDHTMYTVSPGSRVTLTCGSAAAPLTVYLSSSDVVRDRFDRPVTVRMSNETFSSGAAKVASGCSRA